VISLIFLELISHNPPLSHTSIILQHVYLDAIDINIYIELLIHLIVSSRETLKKVGASICIENISIFYVRERITKPKYLTMFLKYSVSMSKIRPTKVHLQLALNIIGSLNIL